MKIKVKLNNITRNFKTNRLIISFESLDNINTLEEIENASELDLEITEHKEKRRLNEPKNQRADFISARFVCKKKNHPPQQRGMIVILLRN